MKFRFVDKITAWTPGKSILGVKAVSFEEYCLRQALGFPETLPESLLGASLFGLADWLIMLTTDFAYRGIVEEVGKIEFFSPVGPGKKVLIDLESSHFGELEMKFNAVGSVEEKPAVRLINGKCRFIPGNELFFSDDGKTLFSEIFNPQ